MLQGQLHKEDVCIQRNLVSIPIFVSLQCTPPFKAFLLLFHFVFLLNYIWIMLLQLSQIFPLCPSPTSTPHSLRQSPPLTGFTLVSSLATPFPILYFTSPWLFCNCLFVLFNPLPSVSHQNTLCIHDSVSVLLVCLVCDLYLDPTVDRYMFIITILLFTVLILLFLKQVPSIYHVIMVW